MEHTGVNSVIRKDDLRRKSECEYNKVCFEFTLTGRSSMWNFMKVKRKVYVTNPRRASLI